MTHTGNLFEDFDRHSGGASEEPPAHFCDECAYFIPYTGRGDSPAEYNPCENGHKMAFYMPDDHWNPYGEFGFYRVICTDREIA